jgi:hypothetical protein
MTITGDAICDFDSIPRQPLGFRKGEERPEMDANRLWVANGWIELARDAEKRARSREIRQAGYRSAQHALPILQRS